MGIYMKYLSPLFLAVCLSLSCSKETSPTEETVEPINQNLLTAATDLRISKSWSQEPQGWLYPMNIAVPTQDTPSNGFPILILLHGNGGNGSGMLNEWKTLITDHILIAPSGYRKSWNISDEASEAPDVEMLSDLIEKLSEFENADLQRIRIIGYSNGAALANRVFIENKNEGIDRIAAVVSQLSKAQYRDNSFYAPSGATGGSDTYDGYDLSTTPIQGRAYLSICNENDPIIPYFGGASVGVEFLPAKEAVYQIAKSQGHDAPYEDSDGSQLQNSSTYEYSYLDKQVVHLRGFANHGMSDTARSYLINFITN